MKVVSANEASDTEIEKILNGDSQFKVLAELLSRSDRTPARVKVT